MAKEKRNWHPRFLNYMDEIINHPNYKGLPIEKKRDGSYRWIATADSEIGAARKRWCLEKAEELGIPIQPGVYADVMLAIHPTKWKVCQTCGKQMSLYYHYPNANFLKSLNKTFNSSFTTCDHINDIWEDLIANGFSNVEVAEFLIQQGGLLLDAHESSKYEIIDALEYECRKGSKKCLGPGAMSNFPDRYDGFHTYNRCCRSTQDKGRSKENLKSYSRDRRAYEYWSDGNIHAANQFMGSIFFDGMSADHIGPISLGFVHDPRYLQPMSSSDNSSKRDRLLIQDIDKIIETEQRTGVYPMSWYSRIIWEYIKTNYKSYPQKVATVYRDALKQNMTNFMYILEFILDNCRNGENFLIKAFLEPNFDYFNYTYFFNEKGEIISQQQRHFTERSRYEIDRYTRIAIDAVIDYNSRDNRHTDFSLTQEELNNLQNICLTISQSGYNAIIKNKVIAFVDSIQMRAIQTL